MSDPKHLKVLEDGVASWNKWRYENEKIKPDLSYAKLPLASLREADLRGANLQEANLQVARLQVAKLSGAKLSWADLRGARLRKADLREADLRGANISAASLRGANLSGADLRGARLSGAKLSWAELRGADLRGSNISEASFRRADLSEADLRGAKLSKANLRAADFTHSDLTKADLTKAKLEGVSFVETILEDADISNSSVYGISAWNLKTNEKTKQLNLVITKENEPIVTVDNIEVAQFIYCILTYKRIRNVINTVANTAVLILGRFTKRRKEVLDAIADKLRTMDLAPIIFDFEPSEEQDIIETVITLASLSKFIIADVTAARVIADELRSFVPHFDVPVVPVFQPSKEEPKPYASLKTLQRKYAWVLEPVEYKSKKHLIEILPNKVIKPAEVKRIELKDIREDESL